MTFLHVLLAVVILVALAAAVAIPLGMWRASGNRTLTAVAATLAVYTVCFGLVYVVGYPWGGGTW